MDIWLGEQLGKLSHLDPGTLVFLLCLLAAFATEILSSSLMLNIFLPVMCDLVCLEQFSFALFGHVYSTHILNVHIFNVNFFISVIMDSTVYIRQVQITI